MRYCERMRARYFPESLRDLPALFESEALPTGDHGAHARAPLPNARGATNGAP